MSTMKLAVVTGAGKGIGAATCRQLLEQGVTKVVAMDIDEKALGELSNSVQSPESLVPLVCDLRDFAALQEKVSWILRELGKPDAVVISHGVADENEISDNDVWDKVVSTNLLSSQRLLSLLVDEMNNGGGIVIISSILGLVGKVKNTAYCTSKHALLGMMKGLALDLARRKINVNAILPCWVDTPMLRNEVQKQADMTGIELEAMLRQIRKRIPLRQFVSSEDVAASVAFLLSPQAKMITAQSLVIDGGEGCGM